MKGDFGAWEYRRLCRQTVHEGPDDDLREVGGDRTQIIQLTQQRLGWEGDSDLFGGLAHRRGPKVRILPVAPAPRQGQVAGPGISVGLGTFDEQDLRVAPRLRRQDQGDRRLRLPRQGDDPTGRGRRQSGSDPIEAISEFGHSRLLLPIHPPEAPAPQWIPEKARLLRTGLSLGAPIPGHLSREAVIKSFSVGLLALAAVAAASYLLRRRKPVPVVVANRGRYRDVGDFYAAGM